MLTNLSHKETARLVLVRVSWREVGAWVADVIGAISIFATGYVLLLIGHGLGLS